MDLDDVRRTYQFVEVFTECFAVLYERLDGCGHPLPAFIGPLPLTKDTLRNVTSGM